MKHDITTTEDIMTSQYIAIIAVITHTFHVMCLSKTDAY